MPRTLFALCRSDGANVVRRVPLENGVQTEIESVFDQQEAQFFDGRDELIEFDGNWNPDSNELLYIRDAELLSLLNQTFEYGAAAYEHLDISNPQTAGVKALFMHAKDRQHINIQRFRVSQFLQKKMLSLMFAGDKFGKLEANGFSLGTKAAAVVQDDCILFDNFPNLRAIMTVQQHFTEATNAEVDEFAKHDSFHIENRALFDTHMDERCRKLIRGISKSSVLNDHDVEEISKRASNVGLKIDQVDGKLVLPAEKKELKVVLSFLEESVYRGVFSADTFITNSKRSVT